MQIKAIPIITRMPNNHITTNTETFEERDRKQSGRNKGMGGEGEKHSFLQKAFMKGIGQSHSTDKRK